MTSEGANKYVHFRMDIIYCYSLFVEFIVPHLFFSLISGHVLFMRICFSVACYDQFKSNPLSKAFYQLVQIRIYLVQMVNEHPLDRLIHTCEHVRHVMTRFREE